MEKNEGIKRIHELSDELAAIAAEIFPGFYRISVDSCKDGYRNITVIKWVFDGQPVEKNPRRYLMNQCRLTGNKSWNEDSSEESNEYLKTMGTLAEE